MSIAKELDESVMPISRAAGSRERIMKMVCGGLLAVAFITTITIFLTVRKPKP